MVIKNKVKTFRETIKTIFRFGHSLVKRSIDRCNKEFRQVRSEYDNMTRCPDNIMTI